MRQSWDKLLFAHWTVPFNKLRAVVPMELELDSYEGNCYVGVVPFTMRHVRPRILPAVPWLSNFLELNLRTYVKDPRNGQRGVYFFSLDASNPVAVEVACKVYHLPYFNALMKSQQDGEWIHYQSVRLHEGEEQLKFKASYRPVGDVYTSEVGSLDAFLTERYCLLLVHKDVIRRGDIHHVRWPLQKAEAKIEINEIAKKYAFDLQSSEPILHYSHHIDTVEWPLG
ncbi:MAG: DUF2071 domain-containing protein [Cyanobacteria bacterium SZAS LIN-2]|nr:DUF2071 domain-containing protein [Cyanobacteria bacterium SZAS LIN-3]MBS1996752.1 DUF2071 domain-containing protein [Cyanobacteria bacterium SZAS LIN-2]